MKLFEHPYFVRAVAEENFVEVATDIVKLMHRDHENCTSHADDLIARMISRVSGATEHVYRFVRDTLRNVVRLVEREDIYDNSELALMGLARILSKWTPTRINTDLDRLRDIVNILGYSGDSALEFFVEALRLRVCDHCDSYEFQDEFVGTFEGVEVCRECIGDSYSWSDFYDEYVLNDSSVNARMPDGRSVLVSEEDDNFFYNDDVGVWTHVDYQHVKPVIRSYHSSKRDQFPQADEWTEQRNRYLGVELEVEAPNGNRDAIAARINDSINEGTYGYKAFFEQDGSLNNGFEIISQPMSLPKHSKLWSWLKDKSLTKGLKSHNTSTCGLHVHISRHSLSALQIGKIVAFVNAPENEDLIQAVARRYGQAATGYCRIKDKAKIGSAHRSQDRYEAVNVSNSKTIEFRIFRGSLKYESVMAAIEFANAMVEFTKPYSGYGCSDMKSECFIQFINKKIPQETKTLRAYITNRLEIA